jgi:tol-pal system protein YbgF
MMRARFVGKAALLAALAATAVAVSPALAQSPEAELLMRLDRIEGQMRQLTGAIEQLQYRNQQLEGQVRRLQEDTEFRFQEMSKGGAARPAQQPARSGAAPQAAPPPSVAQAPAQTPAAPPVRRPDVYDPGQAAPAGRRSDAFDPNAAPDAPGAPRTLGTIAAQRRPSEPAGAVVSDEPTGGAPGGRPTGAPLDLSTAAAGQTSDPNAVVRSPDPAPPVRNVYPPAGQVAALPQPATPRDEYDAAYASLVRKDYAVAEDGMRAFLKKYPSDRMAPDAQFWLGETMFQRQSYREAADAFLAMSKKYEGHPKAPDALFRLAQSLAALNEKELACATFGEVSRKYPRASANVKQAVEREQKRVRC